MRGQAYRTDGYDSNMILEKYMHTDSKNADVKELIHRMTLDNTYDENLFVSPLEENCEKEFVFYPNGEIEGVGERGEYTYFLLPDDTGKLVAYADMIQFFYERGDILELWILSEQ